MKTLKNKIELVDITIDRIDVVRSDVLCRFDIDQVNNIIDLYERDFILSGRVVLNDHENQTVVIQPYRLYRSNIKNISLKATLIVPVKRRVHFSSGLRVNEKRYHTYPRLTVGSFVSYYEPEILTYNSLLTISGTVTSVKPQGRTKQVVNLNIMFVDMIKI